MVKSWEKIQELGPFTNDVWPYVSNEIQKTKEQVSKLCGVKPNRVSLTENVTSGCVLPIWGLPFSKGDRLLISDCEHPGVVAACKELARHKSLEIDILKLQRLHKGVNPKLTRNQALISELEESLTTNTKLVVISHLLWNTGEIIPIELIGDILQNHNKRPFLLVDAAQSFGQIPIDQVVSKTDIYAFTGHKWAFGPEGLGGVILSERILEQARPTFIGWKSLKHEGSIYKNNPEPFHVDGRRFEIATSCTPLLAGLRSSLNLLEKEGSAHERIKKIQRLSYQLWSELKDINKVSPVLQDAPQAGLVSFSMNCSIPPDQAIKLLGKQSIWIRVLEDPIWLRACLHVTSTQKEITKLIEALSELAMK
ncbi:Cysteine desulfurase [Prochlorococcus sp. SS52]|nr:Cysteine desulfurase [Prochlorococcus marinus str. LG]KGG36896.1 Cysteine desulfurase [Prochlorococcus sp. SS52]